MKPKMPAALSRALHAQARAMGDMQLAMQAFNACMQSHVTGRVALDSAALSAVLSRGNELHTSTSRVFECASELWDRSSEVADNVVAAMCEAINAIADDVADPAIASKCRGAVESLEVQRHVMMNSHATFVRDVEGVLKRNPAVAAELAAKMGSIVKAAVTDRVPLYGTVTTIAKEIFDWDVERVLLQNLEEAARIEFAIAVARSLLVQVDLAFVVARGADGALRTALEMSETVR